MNRIHEFDPESAARAAQCVQTLLGRGLQVATTNPLLRAAVEAGATPEQLAELAELHPEKSAGYLLATARGQLEDWRVMQAEGAASQASSPGSSGRRPSLAERLQANERRAYEDARNDRRESAAERSERINREFDELEAAERGHVIEGEARHVELWEDDL